MLARAGEFAQWLMKELKLSPALFHSRQRTATNPSVTVADMTIEKSMHTFVSVSVCMCKDSTEGLLCLPFIKGTIFQIKQCRMQSLILAEKGQRSADSYL